MPSKRLIRCCKGTLPEAPAEGGDETPLLAGGVVLPEVGGEGFAEDTPGVFCASCLDDPAARVDKKARKIALQKKCFAAMLGPCRMSVHCSDTCISISLAF